MYKEMESVTLYTQHVITPSSSKYSGLFKNIELLRRDNVMYIGYLSRDNVSCRLVQKFSTQALYDEAL